MRENAAGDEPGEVSRVQIVEDWDVHSKGLDFIL